MVVVQAIAEENQAAYLTRLLGVVQAIAEGKSTFRLVTSMAGVVLASGETNQGAEWSQEGSDREEHCQLAGGQLCCLCSSCPCCPGAAPVLVACAAPVIVQV